MCNYDGMRNRLYDHNNLAMSSLLIDTHKHPLLLKWRAKSMREKLYSMLCVFFVSYVFASVFWVPEARPGSKHF